MGIAIEPIGRGKFKVLNDFEFGGHIVPAGTITDLDSVPRIPVFYTWFKGRTVSAAIIHDYLYKTKFDREKADENFLRLMALEGVKKRYRLPIYWAVRLFGWIYY